MALNSNCKIQNIGCKNCEVRLLKDIKKVILDKDFAKKFPDLELYYMCRSVRQMSDLRYDITFIPARMLGKEFVRTKGNRNSKEFPELYTVLKGRAIFLLQKLQRGKKDIIEDVYAVLTEKKDWVVVPAKYAVVTINPSKKDLKTGNWVSKKNNNVYKELEKMNGACYFYTKSGWIKNKNYKIVPKLRFEEPLKSRPKSLDFLR